MAELPHAIIDNPPLHRRPWVKKVGIAVAIVAGLFVAKKALHVAFRSDSNKQLERAQDRARKHIGNGLDRMFDQQLDNDDAMVKLDAAFDLSKVPNAVSDSDCENGLTAAFTEALGEKDIVTVTTTDYKGEAPHLGVTAKFSPTDQVFRIPHSDKSFNGLAMSADVKFLGESFHVDVKPADEFEFSYVNTFSIGGPGIDDSQIKGGITQGVCQQLGYSILEKFTTWKRPHPKKRDPVTDCERGFGCAENAGAVAAKDPAAAAKMFKEACDDFNKADANACISAANLELGLAKGHDEHWIAAEFDLEMACMRGLAKTCKPAGVVKMMPDKDGKPTGEYQRGEAFPLLLRGCDLGDVEACTLAGTIAKQLPQFAEAAPLFSGKQAVKSKRYGVIFGLKWGQWTTMGSGEPTLWVTKEPVAPASDVIVTRFDRSEFPSDLTFAPTDVDVVFAIAKKSMIGDRCQRCVSGVHGHDAFSIAPASCVCLLTPAAAEHETDRE